MIDREIGIRIGCLWLLIGTVVIHSAEITDRQELGSWKLDPTNSLVFLATRIPRQTNNGPIPYGEILGVRQYSLSLSNRVEQSTRLLFKSECEQREGAPGEYWRLLAHSLQPDCFVLACRGDYGHGVALVGRIPSQSSILPTNVGAIWMEFMPEWFYAPFRGAQISGKASDGSLRITFVKGDYTYQTNVVTFSNGSWHLTQTNLARSTGFLTTNFLDGSVHRGVTGPPVLTRGSFKGIGTNVPPKGGKP